MRPAALAPLLLALATSPAASQPAEDADKATARTLGLEGQAALKRADFRSAFELFRRAEELYHAPTLLLGLARAQVGLGQLVEARESYLRVLREKLSANPPQAFRQAQADADSELTRLQTRIPVVVLRVEGPTGAQVWLDEQPVPAASLGLRRPSNPGLHRARASAVGFSGVEVTFELTEAEERLISLKLSEPQGTVGPAASASAPPAPGSSAAPALPPASLPAAPAPGWPRAVGWVGVGVGGAGLLVGGVFGLLALERKATLDDACGGGSRCPASARSLQAPYERTATVSTVGFGAAVVGLGLGLPLLLLAPGGRASASGPCLFGGQVGLCGRL